MEKTRGNRGEGNGNGNGEVEVEACCQRKRRAPTALAFLSMMSPREEKIGYGIRLVHSITLLVTCAVSEKKACQR